MTTTRTAEYAEYEEEKDLDNASDIPQLIHKQLGEVWEYDEYQAPCDTVVHTWQKGRVLVTLRFSYKED